MVKRVIRRIKGKRVLSFDSDALGRKFVIVYYGSKSRLGRLFRRTTTRTIRIPKGNKISRIENNKPRIGDVTVTYNKRKK